MLERRDTYGQAQDCIKGLQGSSMARGRRRGFNPAAATHHSQLARAHTDVRMGSGWLRLYGLWLSANCAVRHLNRLNPIFFKNRVEPAQFEFSPSKSG